jgi:uncharacterized protein
MSEILNIIEKYYPPGTLAFSIYVPHCKAVTELALKIARSCPDLQVDMKVLEYGGMLHDIGIFLTDAPEFGCFGDLPYIHHGYKGRELLEKEGLPLIAPVCERHIGVGITLEDIVKNKLPLPHREMVPVTIEEKIVCYADKFFSKSSKDLFKPKPIEKIKKSISKYGPEKWRIFEEMMEMFGTELVYR